MTDYATLKERRDARKARPRGTNSTLPAVARKAEGRVPNPPASPSSSPLKRGGGKKKVSGGRVRRGNITAKPLSRKRPIGKRRRSASEFRRIYGSKARVEWVKSLPCVACTMLSPIFALAGGDSQNAHTETGGKGRKADYTTIVPMCSSHHRMYDEHRNWLGQTMYRDAIRKAAARTEELWQLHASREAARAPESLNRQSELTRRGA